MASIHLHAPASTAKRIVAVKCLDCARRVRLIEFFTPWYGWRSTCLKCGREWADGEWMPLPFAPGGRLKNIDRAKAQWRRMPPVARNHFGIGE